MIGTRKARFPLDPEMQISNCRLRNLAVSRVIQSSFGIIVNPFSSAAVNFQLLAGNLAVE